MPIKLENVAIAVRDLEATIAFFTDLGLTVLGRDTVSGEWTDTAVGLDGNHAKIAMLQTPDGNGRLELFEYIHPDAIETEPTLPNEIGMHRVAFSVDDLDEALAIAARHDCHPLRGVGTYEDIYRLTYVRGPERHHRDAGRGAAEGLTDPQSPVRSSTATQLVCQVVPSSAENAWVKVARSAPSRSMTKRTVIGRPPRSSSPWNSPTPSWKPPKTEGVSCPSRRLAKVALQRWVGRLVEAQVEAGDLPGRSGYPKLHDVGPPVHERSDDAGPLELQPAVRAVREGFGEHPHAGPPGAELPVEVALPVARWCRALPCDARVTGHGVTIRTERVDGQEGTCR